MFYFFEVILVLNLNKDDTLKKFLFLFLFIFLLKTNPAYSNCYYDFSGFPTLCSQVSHPWRICSYGSSNYDDYYAGCFDPNAYYTEPGNCGVDYWSSYPVGSFKVCPGGDTGSGGGPPPPVTPGCTANSKGSVIVKDSQVLIESVDLVGLPFDLIYSSEKVEGRRDWYENYIPVTSSAYSINSEVLNYKLNIQIAGKTIIQIVPPAPSEGYYFIWDGLDGNNNQILGVEKAVITIEEIYSSPKEPPLFVKHPVSYDFFLGSVFKAQKLIGGWNFEIRHHYDNKRKVLYLGNGNNIFSDFISRPNGEIWVPSVDREELFIFDSGLRHIKTLNSYTGAIKWLLEYSVEGNLISVTDTYGNIASIQYVGNDPVSITSPKGQVTKLLVNGNGAIPPNHR